MVIIITIKNANIYDYNDDNNNNNNNNINNKNNNNDKNNNNNNNNNNSPRPGITGLMSSGDSLISWGEGSSLALVGNPSRDGVSIKTLVWRHLKPNPQLL